MWLEQNSCFYLIPKEPEKDEDDEENKDCHLVEGNWSKFIFLFLQHPPDCFLVTKLQSISVGDSWIKYFTVHTFPWFETKGESPFAWQPQEENLKPKPTDEKIEQNGGQGKCHPAEIINSTKPGKVPHLAKFRGVLDPNRVPTIPFSTRLGPVPVRVPTCIFCQKGNNRQRGININVRV